MGIASWLGGILDPSGQVEANSANVAVNNALTPGSPYWSSGAVTGDQAIQQGAAALQQNPVAVNTSNVDTDAAQFGALGDTFGNIAANGGALTQAALHQAQADLANTKLGGMKSASKQAADTVLAQDQAERNWAASGKTQSRAELLANELQKQTWNTAVSHANFEAALAGRGVQYQDQNLAASMAQALQDGASSARNAQQSAARQQSATDFNNAMSILRGATSGISTATSTLAGMDGASASDGNAGTANATGYTSGSTTDYSSGYAVPSTALGTTYSKTKSYDTPATNYNNIDTVKAATQSKYVNPLTGNTVDPNLPTTAASWGDWLTNGSSLVS